MAKKSQRSTRRKKTVRRRQPSKRMSTRGAEMETVAAAARDVDGCDIDFTKGAITPDAELPPARGGVESVQEARRRMAERR
jgi:hypothetical protein